MRICRWGCLQGVSAFFPAPPDGREEPWRIARKSPISAQSLEHGWRDRDLPVFTALAVEDPDDPAWRIDILGAQSDRFAHAQPAMVDERKDGLEAVLAAGAQERANLATAQDQRQRSITPNGELAPELPVAAPKVTAEHPQRDQRLIESSGPKMFLVAQMHEIIEDPAFPDLAQRAGGMAISQFAHLTQGLGLTARRSDFDSTKTT